MRAAHRLAAVAGASILAVGCSVVPGGDDAPRPSDGSPSSTTTSGSGGEDLGTLTGAGEPLTDDELRQALPAPEDLGDDWAKDPGRTVGELGTAQVSPSSCAPLITKGEAWDELRASQRARVQGNYAHAGSAAASGTFMAVWSYSLDDPPPARLFDDAGRLIGDCATMDVTQADTGNISTYRNTQLPFPNLGDRTLALRLKITQSQQSLTMDFVVVKIGHNTISVANSSSVGAPDTDATERAVRSTLESLEENS